MKLSEYIELLQEEAEEIKAHFGRDPEVLIATGQPLLPNARYAVTIDGSIDGREIHICPGSRK